MKWNQLTLVDENFLNEEIDFSATKSDFILKPTSLIPYQAYKILKEDFGQPNSIMFDDTKSQWGYSLQSPDAFFEIYDWKLSSWSICVYLKKGAKKSAEDIANEFLKLIENQASKHNSVHNKKRKNIDGIVIENPFILYSETADSIYKLINDLNSPKHGEDGEIKFRDWMVHSDLCRSAFIMYLSSVEGFINLIYELYMKKELREKRIYDRINREQIDLKLRLAPVYCECFEGYVLNPEADAFKQFNILANLRNDFVHANLTKPMMDSIIYEDNIEFVIVPDSKTAIGIPRNFSEFESQHVKKTKEITQNLIKYVINSMNPRYRHEFEKVMGIKYIKVKYENGQVYIS